jgi:hypothetical protein
MREQQASMPAVSCHRSPSSFICSPLKRDTTGLLLSYPYSGFGKPPEVRHRSPDQDCASMKLFRERYSPSWQANFRYHLISL